MSHSRKPQPAPKPCARCGHVGDLPFDAHAKVPTHVIPDPCGRLLADDQIEMIRRVHGQGGVTPRIVVSDLLATVDYYEERYATIVERCRNDKMRGCWCGLHISPVQGAADVD